ncbi:hypothetical protein L9F63_022268, partial [Diploptera punctata]
FSNVAEVWTLSVCLKYLTLFICLCSLSLLIISAIKLRFLMRSLLPVRDGVKSKVRWVILGQIMN